MRALLAGFVALSAALSCSISAAAREVCGLEFHDPQQLLQEVRSDSHYTALEGSELYLAFAASDRRRILVFTTSASPAHPAVICRRIFERQGAWHVATNAICGGPKYACDGMIAEFDELDKKMADYIKTPKGEAEE